MPPEGTRILTRSQVATLLDLPELIETMECAFAAHAEGKSIGTGMLHFDAIDGLEFHMKAGGLLLERPYFGVKINGASFQNMQKHGLPNILGAIALFDGECGFPLAILDSVDITARRTGATTAAAAKFLARKDTRVATVCGCGKQGRVQLEALCKVLPLVLVHAHDKNTEAAKVYAREMSERLGIKIVPVEDLEQATLQSDVVITCSPSKKAYVMQDFIKPGTFIAAVGADSPDKQEIDEHILQGSKVVVDILDQCARVGELHHAIEKGFMKREDVHGELGQIFSGRKAGRENDSEIIVYDATGTALQDTAAAALCYRKAVAGNVGTIVNLLG